MKGRRHKPLLRLGSYKPTTFRWWVVDKGDINEAENLVYEMTSNGDMSNLKIALLFYSYLNDKDDNFLIEHGFEREEIKFGIENLVSKYGLTGMTDIFLEDI